MRFNSCAWSTWLNINIQHFAVLVHHRENRFAKDNNFGSQSTSERRLRSPLLTIYPSILIIVPCFSMKLDLCMIYQHVLAPWEVEQWLGQKILSRKLCLVTSPSLVQVFFFISLPWRFYGLAMYTFCELYYFSKFIFYQSIYIEKNLNKFFWIFFEVYSSLICMRRQVGELTCSSLRSYDSNIVLGNQPWHWV